MIRHVSIALSFLVVLLLTSCNAPPPAVVLTGSEREAVLAYADPMTDNLLQGMNDGDYATFARDFDAAMAKAIPATSFDAFMASTASKLGQYESRTVSTVESVDNFTRVIYQARFANDDPVTVRVVFNQDHLISGLWFDSAKMRSQ